MIKYNNKITQQCNFADKRLRKSITSTGKNSKQYTFLIYNANKVVVLINKILINFSVVA